MTETPVKKKRGFFSRLLACSAAGKAALATALALLVTLLAVWAVRWFGPQRVEFSHAISPMRVLTEFMLVLVIPAVLYWGLRRWNQVIEGNFTDIDQAWSAGITAMKAQGIDISDYPIFLILGSSSSDTEEALINAMELTCRLHGIPNEPGIRHALKWYVSPDAIYLFCPGASSLSALMSQWNTSAPPKVDRISLAPRPLAPAVTQSKSIASNIPPAPAPPMTAPADLPQVKPKTQINVGTIQLDSMSKAMPQPLAPTANMPAAPSSVQQAIKSPAAAPGTGPYYFGTLSTDHLKGSAVSAEIDRPVANATNMDSGRHLATPLDATALRERVAESAPPAPSMLGTVSPASAPSPMTPAASAKPEPVPPTASPSEPRMPSAKLALPSSLDTSDQLARLRYVCLLLRRIRRPRCGINGILTLLPFELSGAGRLYLSALAQSARGDVNVIQETLGIRSPLSAMLIGLEQDKGFNELVRRLQPELLSRRLGGRFDIRSRSTPEALNNHSDLLCDAFEDWIFRLFGKEDALALQRGNRKLFELTCRIRHELKPRLRIVLGEAFGCETEVAADSLEKDNAFFFSGCYFAASGTTTGQPAFVKGVLHDKLMTEQSQVEWTDATLRLHRLFRGFAIAGWIVTAVLAVLFLTRWLVYG